MEKEKKEFIAKAFITKAIYNNGLPKYDKFEGTFLVYPIYSNKGKIIGFKDKITNKTLIRRVHFINDFDCNEFYDFDIDVDGVLKVGDLVWDISKLEKTKVSKEDYEFLTNKDSLTVEEELKNIRKLSNDYKSYLNDDGTENNYLLARASIIETIIGNYISDISHLREDFLVLPVEKNFIFFKKNIGFKEFVTGNIIEGDIDDHDIKTNNKRLLLNCQPTDRKIGEIYWQIIDPKKTYLPKEIFTNLKSLTYEEIEMKFENLKNYSRQLDSITAFHLKK